MIIAIANVTALLPCLAVLCSLLIMGITFMSILLAKNKLKDNKEMKKDVYAYENDILNTDCDINEHRNDSENIIVPEGDCNENR